MRLADEQPSVFACSEPLRTHDDILATSDSEGLVTNALAS